MCEVQAIVRRLQFINDLELRRDGLFCGLERERHSSLLELLLKPEKTRARRGAVIFCPRIDQTTATYKSPRKLLT